MILYFAGALNGNYSPILQKLDPRPDWILCVGSFGVWPDPQRVDRATKRRGVGDFPSMYLRQAAFPYQTLFVEGTHEDHAWLWRRELHNNFEVLPNVSHLKNGNSTMIGDSKHALNVLGLGKPFSPKMDNPAQPWPTPPYYTKKDVMTACSQGPVDVLLGHEGLQGETYGGKACLAKGLKKVIYATRPKLFVHGHFNAYREYSFMDTKCYSLANGQLLLAEWDGVLFRCSIV